MEENYQKELKKQIKSRYASNRVLSSNYCSKFSVEYKYLISINTIQNRYLKIKFPTSIILWIRNDKLLRFLDSKRQILLKKSYVSCYVSRTNFSKLFA